MSSQPTPAAPPTGNNGAVNHATAPDDAAGAGFPIAVIGASAGGLEACGRLLDGIPAQPGICFIIVQHLDPAHDSMMVDLLGQHTMLPIRDASDGLVLAPDHIYVIPPACYLAVCDGRFQLTRPQPGRGSRMPFDFLLNSLAASPTHWIFCVILSGTGDDGARGVQAVKRNGALVIAQDPLESASDGMPRSAILTGAVDLVLAARDIGPALVRALRAGRPAGRPSDAAAGPPENEGLAAILAALRLRTGQDFALYKTGTLRRRVERRLALAGLPAHDLASYAALLPAKPEECDALANDLLINVTGFFRDPAVFLALQSHFIPDLLASGGPSAQVRIWVAGCSTGEEAYSLAMLFQEAAAEARSPLRLQIFASDADAQAISTAREGIYPEAALAQVSPERLKRFFVAEHGDYRVVPSLRSTVVFAVQDVLTDAPFSRIDLVSCRNLLIYLRPEAQARVMAILHFALRPGGLLVLGNTETTSLGADKFELLARTEKIYRRVGPGRGNDLALALSLSNGEAPAARAMQAGGKSRQTALAELCNRLVMEHYVAAAVLVNAARECLQSFGQVDRYLRVPAGPATQNILALASPELAVKLRAALHQASKTSERATLLGGRSGTESGRIFFDVTVIPTVESGEQLYLVCFVDRPGSAVQAASIAGDASPQGLSALERELNATRAELQGALHSLDLAAEEQKAVSEEARSVQEEYQSTNEELLTSKEELQSLNEELTALNGQLQETLDRQLVLRTDLENVLYSTNVATVFLDMNLRIRFFTPATRAMFNILAADIGRPLADLKFFATDDMLLADAHRVMSAMEPVEREVRSGYGRWYQWRILPYRTPSGNVQGVVILFNDVTERHAVADALQTATEAAKGANLAKSRFLASASHDLRQPLQTLVLLQHLISALVTDDRAQLSLKKMDGTLTMMSGMLNTLLDINQLESGMVSPMLVAVAVDDFLQSLQQKFEVPANELGLNLRVVSSKAVIQTDPRLMEQILANLVSNALKYTSAGRVLVGCRHLGDRLAIEVWDTGMGIASEELATIFNEYYQLGNPARERSRGVGLGLAIVKRLAALMGHRVYVRSTPGKGSMFGIEAMLSAEATTRAPTLQTPLPEQAAPIRHADSALVMIIEDDGELRRLLEMLLYNSGFRTITAPNGITGISMVTHGDVRPDLVLADFNLPDGMTGLQCVSRIRKHLNGQTPAIILTGDNSVATKHDVEKLGCRLVQKPAKFTELKVIINGLLAHASGKESHLLAPPDMAGEAAECRTAFIIDDDPGIREMLCLVLEQAGWTATGFVNCETFLAHPRGGETACLLVDAYLPGMSGIELIRHLRGQGDASPAIMITGNSDVSMAVEAMKAGASDFIEKPVGRGELLAALDHALELAKNMDQLQATRRHAASLVAKLTSRQIEVMTMVLAGQPSKNIAADLDISQRTVENHRAAIMQRLGVKSIPALARLAAAATADDA